MLSMTTARHHWKNQLCLEKKFFKPDKYLKTLGTNLVDIKYIHFAAIKFIFVNILVLCISFRVFCFFYRVLPFLSGNIELNLSYFKACILTTITKYLLNTLLMYVYEHIHNRIDN